MSRARGTTSFLRRALAIAVSILALPLFVHTAVAQVTAHVIVLSGTVRDSSGAPIGGAEVALLGTQVRGLTDAGGRFRLGGVRVGSVALGVRRLGFRPAKLDVVVDTTAATVDVLLVPLAQPMAGVRVTERRAPFDGRLAGFNNRKTKSAGHFVTRERIEQQGSTFLSDYLRQVPGLKIMTVGGFRKIIRLRGATCPPLVFVDGFPATAGEFDVDIVDPVSVEGIEVYSGVATVPAEFVVPRDLHRCGVIAIWSRPMRPYESAAARQAARAARGARPVDVERLVEAEKVFTAGQVDRPAEPTGALDPVYPDSLWGEHQRGRVVVQFVVDTLGGIEPGTFGVVSSSHASFADAVRDAVSRAVFRPAMRGGRLVRQLVQLPVEFAPAKPSPPPQPPTS